jgi:hypothetical protein
MDKPVPKHKTKQNKPGGDNGSACGNQGYFTANS